MIFSAKSRYAVRALLYAAKKGGKVRVGEVAEKTKVPKFFLSKIFEKLAKEKILKSEKGRSGGFTLIKPLNDISLYKIKKAVEGTEDLEGCLLSSGVCTYPTQKECPLHKEWETIRANIINYMKKSKISDIPVS